MDSSPATYPGNRRSFQLNKRMAFNVTEIQNRIASLVDQSSTAPDVGGDDWNLRLKYINMAQNEAFDLYDWGFLFKEYSTQTSTISGNTSISMPNDFRKLASFPRICFSGVDDQFPEVRVQERFKKLSSDRFVYFLGSGAGYTMVVHAGLSDGQLPSGASIYVPYYSSGASLTTGSDVSMIPDPEYLVKRSVAMLWEAREDDRFPQMKAEADKLLQRLLERENVFSEANNDESQIRTVEEKRFGFRLGRN